MKTTKIFVIIIFLALVSVQSFSQSNTEQAVLKLSQKKFSWLINKQTDSLKSVLDDRLMFVHSNGWTETKQELLDDLKNGKLDYISIDVSEASVRVFESTAVVTGKGKFSVEVDGNPLVINLFYTEVYILKNKKWLLASRHSNRMP
jgi:hypothetical protein